MTYEKRLKEARNNAGMDTEASMAVSLSILAEVAVEMSGTLKIISSAMIQQNRIISGHVESESVELGPKEGDSVQLNLPGMGLEVVPEDSA